jgi:translation elongation factor EF-Tu-like GTPase
MSKAVIQIFGKSINRGRNNPIYDNYRPTLQYYNENSYHSVSIKTANPINPDDFGIVDISFIFDNSVFKNKSFGIYEGSRIVGWGQFI